MEIERVEVMDLYLAAYYLIRGCSLEEVRHIPMGKTAACNLIIKGEGKLLRAVQEEFFASTAMVNLLAFRNAYNQVNGAVHQAKRNADAGKMRDGGVLPKGGTL